MDDPAGRATSAGSGGLPPGGFGAMVPELLVTDIGRSVRFWCDMVGFDVAYERPAAGFAYLTLGGAQVMLCQRNGRWEAGEMRRPFGRGVNFQIRVDRLDTVLDRLGAGRWPLFEAASESWFRVGATEVGQREFLVQDPDGYLLRLAERLGERTPV